MKKLLSILFIAVLLSIMPVYSEDKVYTTGNPDTSTWYEWKLPNEKLAKGTAIDASFLLDAPSGKHGFAKKQGENIVFEDGTPVRFWGTNVVMQSNFLTKEEAERLADRIARCGFNLVRFHHLDINREKNIFSETAVTTTKKLDPNQLDKLFYFISLLKERGIYFYMDLLVMRPAMAGDDIPAMEDLVLGWKAHAVFDPYLVELQKEYAKQILTTKNPYTNLTLAQDPSLVFIDIHNELSILQINAKEITSSYYRAEYQSLFNRWLEKKYPSREKLKEAWAELGKVGLEDNESFTNGTVNILGDGTVQVPNLYNELNYSNARKHDYFEFTYELLYNFYEDFRDYLKEELEVKALITGTSMGGSTNKRGTTVHLNLRLMDFTDAHTYKSHPESYGFTKGGKLTSWTTSTIVGGGELHRSAPWLRAYDQPYVIGEWQVCSPGPNAAEGSLVQSVVCSFQDWHAVQFDMASAASLATEISSISTFFATFDSADHTTIQPACGMLYLRGDVEPAKGSYYTVYNKEDMLDEKIYRSAHLLGLENAWMYAKVGMAAEETISPDNEMTPEALEEAFKKYRRNEPGEDMDWNKRMGIMRVDTEYTNIATGYIGGKTISLSFSDITVENPSATISINSVSKNTLNDTDRILLTAVSKARNTGLEMDDNGMVLQSAGSAPMIIEPITADFVIKTTKEIKVYALDSSGQRTAEVPVSKTDEGYSSFGIGKNYKAVHYEIVK